MGFKAHNPETIGTSIQLLLDRAGAKGIAVTVKPRSLSIDDHEDGFSFPLSRGSDIIRKLRAVKPGVCKGSDMSAVWEPLADVYLDVLEDREARA